MGEIARFSLAHPGPEFWRELFEEMDISEAKKELLKIIYDEIIEALKERSLDEVDRVLLQSLKAAIELALSNNEEEEVRNATKLIGIIRSVENGKFRRMLINRRFRKWKS